MSGGRRSCNGYLCWRTTSASDALITGDHKILYVGDGTSFADNDLIAGSSYHYALFAYDNAKNYSTALRAVDVAMIPTWVLGSKGIVPDVEVYLLAKDADTLYVAGKFD